MVITVKQLQHVIAILDKQGYRKAAKSQYITQAGISNSVKALEFALNEKIFEPGQATLTPYGKIALPWIRDFVAHYDQLSQSLKRLSQGNMGKLHVASVPSILSHCIPPVLDIFKQQCTNVQIFVSDHSTHRIHNRLLQNEIDVAISPQPVNMSDDIKFIHLYNDPLGVLLPTAHPLSHHSTLKLSTLIPYDFIRNGQTLALQKHPEIAQLNNNSTQYIDNLLSLVTMVELGMGISLTIGGSTMQSLNKNIAWIPIEGDINSRTIGVMFHKNNINHPTISVFVHMCIEILTSQ